MITCKEDLINTYVKTDGEELVRLYLEKCKEFGFTWFSGADISSYKPNGSAVGLNKDITLSVTNGSLDYFDDENCRELTLSDLKPTPTKFVKVEESIFDLKEEFEKGELYSSDCEGHYTQLKCEKNLYLAAHQDSVYRQVEIDWRDILRDGDDFSVHDGMVASDGLVEEDKFIAMCHAIAELTEKPEGV